MSVINKMLRDLDQRQAGQPRHSATAFPGQRAALGVVPVMTLPLRSHVVTAKSAAWAVLLILALGGSGWWYQQSGQRSATPSVQTAGVQVEAPLSMSASVPDVAATAAKAVQAKPVAARAAASRPLPGVEPPGVAVVPNTAATTLHMESSLMRPPVSKKVAQPAAVPTQAAVAPQTAASPPAVVASPAVVARPAALDALAQAQSLWSAGSHTAAIELLGQALSRVESTATSSAPMAAQSPLASLARELARMQLADGQVSQALSLLKRLEPQLAQVADVWAMRGNAAQRLGQHAEAAQSYQRALALRPDEARWMLGAAVSLAAQGQTAAAGELADKARGMGALRPDVANYLHQLGVVIRSD